MPDGRRLDATGEPLELEHLDPERPARQREAARVRLFQQLPPGRLGELGRRSERAASNMRLGLYACCVALVLAGSRVTTGQWIHGWSVLLTVVLTSGMLALLGWLNRRRP
jgi:hypothetical protein